MRADLAVVEFGPFRLDKARRQLTRDGAPVPLGHRAFEILLVLIRYAPETVSKATLFEQVWPGAAVEESTLRFHLWTLRKALGTPGRYILTDSRKGYRFIAPLSPQPAVAAEQTAERDAPPATNLPLSLTEIVGRERELAELDLWLKHSRLVTLTGPGGVGKTRLAVELGRRLVAEFPAGVWLIDLAPLTNWDAVVSAVAATLGVSATAIGAVPDAIIGALGKTRPLLIVDNCEHLAAAAATLIRTLLERASGVAILVTSRTHLQLVAERIFRLDPLEVPPAGTTEIAHFAAVQLFVQRGHASDRQFELTDTNRSAIGEICRKLDGLPLALEMAAGRLRLLGVERLRAGLGDRLQLLRGAADGDERHGSLQGMLDWSHSLLTPFDRMVFRRLGIFSASFSLDAAVAVASGDEAARWAVVDALSRLFDQSLVALERPEPTRYRLLETLRLYASDKLREAGETDAAAERHARHLVTVFSAAEACWETTPDPDWIGHYLPEVDHLRAALDWALAAPERRQITLILAASGFFVLERLWLFGEGCKYRDRIMPLLDADTPTPVLAQLLNFAAIFYLFAQDPDGVAFAERSAALWRELGDGPRSASPLLTLAQYRTWQGRPAEASELLLEVRQLLAGSAAKKTKARLALVTGLASYHTNDLAEARRHLEEALESARALRSRNEVVLLSSLALVEYTAGDVGRAIDLARTALSGMNPLLGRGYFGLVLRNLAAYLIASGELVEARQRLQEAFSSLVESGNGTAVSYLQLWAVLMAAEGRLVEAAQLIGSADAARTRRGLARQSGEKTLYDRLMATLEAGLLPDERAARMAEGAEWSEREAIEFVANHLLQLRDSEISDDDAAAPAAERPSPA